MSKNQKLIKDDVEARDVSLAPLTSWHIGGEAERYFCPSTSDSLREYLTTLAIDVPCTWLGLGSNVLIRDGGIQGAVIATRRLQTLFQDSDGTVFAEAGLTCAKLAKYCTAKGFAEAAFFAGIPGTVGGALAMNAGAFGSETWEWVKAVKVIDRKGQIIFRDANEYDIGYRSVVGRTSEQAQEAFLGAIFKFPASLSDKGGEKIKALLRKRADSQPIGTFNCGSVYRNPTGDFAARLIESCDLKGYQVGNAMISPKHANFIINCGQACSEDVETLMNTVESQVFDRFGIALHREVRILGQKEKK
jgi:UDP-N-acetylmuramate dehydrogenase